jgi:hypothetical protein
MRTRTHTHAHAHTRTRVRAHTHTKRTREGGALTRAASASPRAQPHRRIEESNRRKTKQTPSRPVRSSADRSARRRHFAPHRSRASQTVVLIRHLNASRAGGFIMFSHNPYAPFIPGTHSVIPETHGLIPETHGLIPETHSVALSLGATREQVQRPEPLHRGRAVEPAQAAVQLPPAARDAVGGRAGQDAQARQVPFGACVHARTQTHSRTCTRTHARTHARKRVATGTIGTSAPVRKLPRLL